MPKNLTEEMLESTLSNQAYERLKKDIVHGRLAPNTRLAVRRLSDNYDIGASPIREALHRLVGEGMVVAIGQRGFRAAPIALTDLQDLTQTRTMLETEALRQSIRNGGDAWEADVVATYYQLSKLEGGPGPISDFLEWERRNQAFHRALVAACDSRWLQRFLGILHDQHRRYRYLSIQSDTKRDVANEHAALRDAVLDRDEEMAVQILTSHIKRTADTLEGTLP